MRRYDEIKVLQFLKEKKKAEIYGKIILIQEDLAGNSTKGRLSFLKKKGYTIQYKTKTN